MMEITRKNYESYFVDYLEGKLDEKLVDQFLEFLQENPDLKAELKLFESASVAPEDAIFSKKDELYKEKYDLEDEFNSAAVARIEENITPKEKREFDAYLSKHPEKEEDLRLFSHTILQADEQIHFAHKNKLYKKPGRAVALFWAGRVAAVLILALAIFSLVNRNEETVAPANQMASVQEKVAKKEETPKEKQIPEPAKAEEVTANTEAEKDAPVKKIVVKPETKQVTPEKKENKSIREKHGGRLEEKEAIAERIPLEIPKQMRTLTASIDVHPLNADLGIMTLVYPPVETDDEHLLADNLKGKISLSKITKAGLNIVTSISNERFTYETNNEGKVTEYNYESKLLAFSIPSSKPDKE